MMTDSPVEMALTVENVSLYYGKKEILKNINLGIYKGEVFGLLGPNGAGKSSLLSVLCALLRPQKGRIYVGHQLTLGYVPQEIALYPELSAYDNLAFWGSVYRVPHKKERIHSLLEFLELSQFKKTPVYKVSVGIKRRLNIAVALLHDPDIMIMDEPTVGIDLNSKLMMLDEIKKLKSLGKTFVYTTHHVDEPEKICDRIGILKNGMLEAVGTIEDLKKDFGKNAIEDLMR